MQPHACRRVSRMSDHPRAVTSSRLLRGGFKERQNPRSPEIITARRYAASCRGHFGSASAKADRRNIAIEQQEMTRVR